MLALESTHNQPLKYFSGSLSTCIHILIFFVIFAQTYKQFFDTQEPVSSADSAYEEPLNFDSEYDDEDAITDQHETVSEDTIPEEQQEITPEPSQDQEIDHETIISKAQEAPHIQPQERVIKKQQRLRQAQNRWKKKPDTTTQTSGTAAPVQTAAQRMGAALHSNYQNWVNEERQAFEETLRAHHSTVNDLERERRDYHLRVLQAIKATTTFFVKHYYAARAFVTPKIHVSINLAPDGRIIDVKLEPNTQHAELDQAIQSFVHASQFSKKPPLLQKIADGPYDFYILPLTINQGENILKLIAHF